MRPWGAFRPDVAGPNSAFAQIADSVLPQTAAFVGAMGQASTTIGYGPFPQFITAGSATPLSGAPRGGISLTTFSGTNEVFFATASTIEQLSATYTFSSIDTGRTVPGGEDVSFLHFGSFLLNSDKSDGFKAYNIETPAGNNAVSGAPTARFLFSCNNVVFALDCNGNNLRMQSSGLGDHTTWTTLGANGLTFTDGGALQAGVDLKNGNAVVFQSNAMRLIQFGNAVSPALYSVVKAADGRGCVGPRSVVSFDGMVFYLATDGFYKFDLSNGNTPIGAEKINRWFLDLVDASRLVEVQGAVDPRNKIVCWRFYSITNPSSTVADMVIGYHWQLDEWFTLTVNTSSLASIATPGYVLDSMDSFGVLDSITTVLDDRFWQGGQPLFAGLDASFNFATFSGSPMAATLQGSAANSGLNALENEITPISDNPNSTISLGVQYRLSDPVTWKAPMPRSRGGKVKLRGSGLNLTLQENHAAGDNWSYANGVDYPEAMRGGPI